MARRCKRGLNPQDVRAVPLSAGEFGHEDEVGRRVVRVLAFYQYDRPTWAHPIDGVVAYVISEPLRDQGHRRLDLPVPAEEGVERRAARRARAH
jgi:primary-amine oxidase